MKLRFLFSKLLKKIHIPAVKDSIIHKSSKVCSHSHLVNVSMDKYSYIGNYTTVLNAKIGSFCSIADNCIIGGLSHPINWVSSSPVFHEGKNILKKNFSEHSFEPGKDVEIGNDVWIGNNCLLKSGIKISDGAIIGMGSVVTKNVGPYEIWAGNPAKLIKKRFDEELIRKLLEIKWWNYNEDNLIKYAQTFNKVNKFIEEHREVSNENSTLG